LTAAINPEELWSRLLSGEPERIRAAWNPLRPEEKASVHAHLQSMAHAEGWHPGQREAALAALRCLSEIREA
jgi:hypothetical protein